MTVTVSPLPLVTTAPSCTAKPSLTVPCSKISSKPSWSVSAVLVTEIGWPSPRSATSAVPSLSLSASRKSFVPSASESTDVRPRLAAAVVLLPLTVSAS
ncbi:hypothetical protein D3C85_78260 [compost metagenome]